MTADAAVAVFSGSPINGQSFSARATNLAQPDRTLYRNIIEGIIEGAPRPVDSTHAVAIARLIEADLVQTDGDGRVKVAYPFSTEPTRHQVTLPDGRNYYAMCAIDALGIPYMLHERGEVQAQEPDARGIVRVTVGPGGEPTWTPVQAVAVVAFGDGCCLAQNACPHINLFVSPDTATRYLDTHTLQGNVLSITDAASVGQWLFGDLLRSLADNELR